MRFTLLFILALGNRLQAQEIRLTWKGQPFELQQRYVLTDTTSIVIDEFKFYIQAKKADRTLGIVCVDASNPSSLRFDLNASNWQLGLDSSIQVSGEFDGALDPLNGMYWAWNTGFISLKCVGTIYHGVQQKLPIELHLGGYKQPFACTMPLYFSNDTLQIDLYNWLKFVPIQQQGLLLMLPSQEAKKAFDLFQNALTDAP
ncbi:MAG: hypothetical protein RLZZ301_670 [Bacteroidota bacterium]|jgi:hypothetical protein